MGELVASSVEGRRAVTESSTEFLTTVLDESIPSGEKRRSADTRDPLEPKPRVRIVRA